ncbi:LOW QUALITY PROTEIN: neural cell adhesion molecule 1-like [Parambassis ranga]|uniref:LOW QUALITY PROTEIN: neural cell adhesion molecule 1-like n=1 Tax=Parambassis ranga TaxID=210632 RepID=A0A6P7JKA8_9TELE|nr:LOW QUALITY PROTEIN: neural cell adhesion molecule 1-like [Parambassis ranga]
MLQIRDLIWGLLFIGCAAAIQVQITPSQGEISLGESKFFLCEVVGDAKEIDWYAPSGEKILPNRQDIIVSRSDESTSALTIYHAKEDSAGIYKCVARNGDKEAQATVQVNIFQKITFLNAPSPQEFNEGDDANIICHVVGSPPPNIFWKHKGSRIHPAQDVRFRYMPNGLQIRGIKKTDEGMYVCEARIIVRGELDFRTIKVVVNVLPTIRARHSEVNATADIGNSALLACDADGFPEPTVTWAHNNVVLESGDKYSLNEDGSELVIKDVKKVDEGDYTCIAKNKAGEKSEEVSLNVFVQPKITYLKNQTASEFDEEVTLTCEASGDPTPTISWSFGNRVFSEGEQSHDRNIVVRSHARVSSLSLKNIQFTYSGHYLCTASNSIGQDDQQVYLEVRYAPKILGSVTVYTWEGNPANISCEVVAHPGASVVWFRDGLPLPTANTTNMKIYNTPKLSYLEITPDSQNDFGSYNCTATNVMGTESKEFLLIQAEVPSAPEITQVDPFSSTAVVEFEEPDSMGGVPIIKYRVEWRLPGKEWTGREYDADDDAARITIVGLKPETTYEVRMSAINGKGEGESSAANTFKTEPVRYSFTISSEIPPPIPATSMAHKGEPSAPKLEVKVQSGSNSLQVNWIKQDDGGSPIKHYLVRYKAKHVSDWKPEIRLPHGSEHVVLSGLEWNTEYEIHVVAENQQGKSQPGILSFRTATEPTTIPDAMSGLGTGAIVGILIVVFFLLLVGVDVTCYFLNKCGLLMCIAVNLCGKAGPGAKSKDIEEGQAAFTKDESKEPIVEVRTEEENTPNQEGGGGPTEPNETTPLTEPEPAAADTPSMAVNLLPSTAANSESFSTAQSSPASECTTLTTSASSPTKVAPANSSPKTAASLKANTQPDVGPLVDLSDTPNVAPSSSNPTPPVSEPVSQASASPDGPQSQSDSVKAPDSSQSQDLRVDGPAKEATNAQCADSTTPAQNDGKTVKDDNTKGETEVNNTTAEVKTVPNEAPQANGNESKA